MSDFLPEPDPSQLTIKPAGYNEQDLLYRIVKEIYDIQQDDKLLRGVLNLPIGKKCGTFDKVLKVTGS